MSEAHSHHITSANTLWSVGIGLVILTGVTVMVSNLGLPSPLDIVSALIIAFGKAYLVAAYFMGLKWDNKFNVLLLLGSLIFISLMIGVTLLDTLYRVETIPSF